MANQQANEILESDEKDLFILSYLGRKVFPRSPENEKRRQWWLANSDFTEHDFDLISDMAKLFGPVSMSDRLRAHINSYMSNSHDQIVGADSPLTYSGLRELVKKIRDSAAFWESSSNNGSMSNQLANEILESDEEDPFILFYLGRKVFGKTPENEKQRQWWLANTEFSEIDLNLISDMANLFRPMDASKLAYEPDKYCTHINRYLSNSQDQIVGVDSSVTYSGLRDLIKRIRGSAAFPESFGNSY